MDIKNIKRVFVIAAVISLINSGIFAEPPASGDYTLKQPRIVVSVGETVSINYILDNAIIGGVFGGKAESANYSLQTYFLPGPAIYVCPLNWKLSGIDPGESTIASSADRIIVKNTGGVKTSFSLSVIDVSGAWEASDTPDGNDINKFILSGIFTDKGIESVSDIYFNEAGTEDLILCNSQLSTDTKFASALCRENGASVSPGEERALWLKFTAPRIDTTNEESHNLWLILEVK